MSLALEFLPVLITFKYSVIIIGLLFGLIFVVRHLSALLSGKKLGELYAWNVIFLDVLFLFFLFGMYLFAEQVVVLLVQNFDFGIIVGGI